MRQVNKDYEHVQYTPEATITVQIRLVGGGKHIYCAFSATKD